RPERLTVAGPRVGGERRSPSARRQARSGTGRLVARSDKARHLAALVAGVALLAGCVPPVPDPGPTQTDLRPQPPVDCPAVTGTAAESAPGARGRCDTYCPGAGNGGCDVGDYRLDLTSEAARRMLTGIATITATATANLSSFNLDLV